MNAVFADTHYWIATINPRDQWHERAMEVSQSFGPIRLVTTDDVLVEVLNFFAGRGEAMRRNALRTVRSILGNPDVETRYIEKDDFLDGLQSYESRPDKG